MAVDSHAQSVSDRAVLEATGRHPDEWFAFLDAQQATGWKHRQMVDWLLAEAPHVGAWWAQAITVRYEQARGMRQPGERADGFFEGSVTRSFAGAQLQVLDAAIAAISAVHGNPARITRGGAYPSARWVIGEQALEARVNPEKGGKSPVVLTWSQLPDSASLGAAKTAMSTVLDSIGGIP